MPPQRFGAKEPLVASPDSSPAAGEAVLGPDTDHLGSDGTVGGADRGRCADRLGCVAHPSTCPFGSDHVPLMHRQSELLKTERSSRRRRVPERQAEEELSYAARDRQDGRVDG